MCTGIRFADKDGNLYFGRNLDWTFSYGEKPIITPRGFAKPWAFNGGDAGTDDARAVIGMGIEVEGLPLYFDCANEDGLAVAGLNFPGFAQYEPKPVDGKVNVVAYEFPLWVAKRFSTVDQVEEALKGTAIVAKPVNDKYPVAMLHWLIGDGTRSIVVECMDSGLHVHHDDIDVLTNQPQFDWHRENLRDYMNLTPAVPADVSWRDAKLTAFGSGFGMRGLPGGFCSPDRFVRVAYLHAHYPEQETEAANVSRMFHTLTGVAMIDGGAKVADGDFERTLYTGGYSARTQTYYWSTYEDPAIKSLALAGHDLDGKELAFA